jgi:DNA-binding MarR family transcriptional regulator
MIVPDMGQPPGDEAVVVRAVLRLARRLRQAASDSELTGGALGLLATLRREGSMSAVELARREGLKPQSLSRLIASLDRAGFIERALDAADRRRQLIAITRPGTSALRRSMNLRRRWLAGAMAEWLNPRERSTLLDAAELMLRMVA